MHFPVIYSVMAAAWGWAASQRDGGSQWPAWLMDLPCVELGAHQCRGSRKSPLGPEWAEVKPCEKQRMVS